MACTKLSLPKFHIRYKKSKLIEKIADLFKAKKLSLLANIRDESTEDIRIVLDPKSRSVDPALLMESLFKTTDLEVRISLNMNVLDKHGIPNVLSLKEVLLAFLDHRMEVLIRRTKFRLGNIEHRLEILGGFLIAYLNIDEVIRIIREEDRPKETLMTRFKLSDVQAEAILNMRLRSLRKLEEMEIKREHDALNKEKKELLLILNDETVRVKTLSEQIKETKKKFGKDTPLGARRTDFSEADDSVVVSIEAFIEKEPITILCSEKGWIKALKGHIDDVSDVKYKDGDKEHFVIHGYTTDKLLVFADNGKFYTIGCNTISGGKGHGEPLNLLVDMDQHTNVISLLIYNKNAHMLVANSAGRGFIVPAEDVIAQTKNGKQVLNLSTGIKARVCVMADGDSVAVIGQNRKLLIFPKSDVPVMKRGSGVILQRYKQGGLSDARCFNVKEGLSWKLGQKTRTETDLRTWIDKRAAAGKLPPVGFPRNNLFG